jgi:PAS domain S-box-containing protein
MSVGVYVCDETGALVAVNPAGLDCLGASSIEEVRDPKHPYHFPTLYYEDGREIPPDRLPLQRALRGEEVVEEMEMYDHQKRGVIILRTRSSPIRNADGVIIGAVKVATDVTREHELNTAKDEFVKTAAHELKTPIAIIKANADAALDAMRGESGPARRHLEGLSRGVDRIDRLINSLLDLLDLQGSIFSFSRTPIRLDRLIESAIAKLPDASASRVAFIASLPVLVRCDEPRMRRALYSLVDNAIKYSPRGSQVEVGLERTGDLALTTVRDHGFGIPSDKQPRIFEKFFRAHAGTPRDMGGIGVGLFVTREIVAQHGGRIWFESVENVGTTFFVELPVEGMAL